MTVFMRTGIWFKKFFIDVVKLHVCYELGSLGKFSFTFPAKAVMWGENLEYHFSYMRMFA